MLSLSESPARWRRAPRRRSHAVLKPEEVDPVEMGNALRAPRMRVVATLRRTIGVDRTNARCGARDEGRIAPCEGSRLPPFIDDDRNLYSKHYDRHVICQGSRRKKVRGTCRRGGRRRRIASIVETAARIPHEAHRRAIMNGAGYTWPIRQSLRIEGRSSRVDAVTRALCHGGSFA